MFAFTSDIPCGNGRLLSHEVYDWGDEISFAAESRFAEPRPMWFCFRVSGLKGGTARFHVANAHQFLADTDVSGWANNRPVWRQGGAWRRTQACRVTWEEDGMPRVTFDIPCGSGDMEVAFCYPYGQGQVDEAMAGATDFTRRIIGYSTKGRPIYRYATGGGAACEKPGVYILCRQHAGEVGGAWLLDGMLRYWASDKGRDLLQKICVWVVPIVDVDAVAEGAYGKDQPLGDMNRSYKAKYAARTEIDAVVQDMYRWKERCRPCLVSDYHSPAHEVLGVLLNVHLPIDAVHEKKILALMDQVNLDMEKQGSELERFETNYDGVRTPLTVHPDTMAGMFTEKVLALPYAVWEISYQGAQRGGAFALEDYRAYGRHMAGGLAAWLSAQN